MISTPLQTRPVLDSDFEWLFGLRLATMSEHFEASGHFLSPEEQRDRLRQQYSAIRIIQIDGSDVGMVKVNRAKHLYERLAFEVVDDLGYSYEMRSDALKSVCGVTQ